jgi:DNA processing protein
MRACDACLRRAALLAAVTPRLLREVRESRRLPEALALGDDELIQAVCGQARGSVDMAMARFDAEVARSAAGAAGLATVCRHDTAFPARLRDAADAPRALFLLGDPGRLRTLSSERPVAIVGSRRASPYGLEVARALGRDLGACGVPVVSGMALGADSAAHEGALEAGGPTVAVMPGGADYAYPRSKRHLHRRIARAGLAVSEMPPGFGPHRLSFPARNRIMAALAVMTVVVEGAAGSGSLITAGFAQDLGRDVGAVPGQVTSALAAGPNRLLADGALMVLSSEDVLDAVYGPGRGPRPARSPPALAARLAQVLSAVERGLCAPGEIAADGHAVDRVLADLTELELLGLVRRDGAGRYVRCAYPAT